MLDFDLSRRSFFAKLGGAAAVAAMAPEALAEALEHEIIEQLAKDPRAVDSQADNRPTGPVEHIRKGIGHVFDDRMQDFR